MQNPRRMRHQPRHFWTDVPRADLLRLDKADALADSGGQPVASLPLPVGEGHSMLRLSPPPAWSHEKMERGDGRGCTRPARRHTS